MLTEPTWRIKLLGRHHVEYGTYVSAFLGNKLAAGITAGPQASSERTTPNEDCLGIVQYDDGSQLYMVADGHKGREAAEIAIEVFPVAFQVYKSRHPETIEENIRKAIMETHDTINRIKKDRSKTTLVGMLKQGQQTFYVQVGDSFLYQSQQGNFRHIPNRNMIEYLGQEQPLRAIDTGQLTLNPLDKVVLASDGPHNYGIESEYLSRLAHEDTKILVDHILKLGTVHRKGSIWDNMALIAIEE